jgi:hypothetical protein
MMHAVLTMEDVGWDPALTQGGVSVFTTTVRSLVVLCGLAVMSSAAEPGAVTVTKPTTTPATGTRYYVVQVKIIEVDANGQETVIATPTLQTVGAAAGVTIEADTGRRFNFEFAAADVGAPVPLPVIISEADLPSGKADPAQLAAQKRLEQKVSIKAVQQPRRDVLRSVAKQAGLTVAIEPETATLAAAKLADPITFEVDNASLDETLRRLVAPLETNFAVKHDLVLIGLEGPERKPKEPAREPQPIPKGLSVKVYAVSDLLTKTQPDEEPDLAPLMQQLRTLVDPKSWSEQGGEGSMRAFPSTASIVVRQTDAGHAAVQAYLEKLRKRASE